MKTPLERFFPVIFCINLPRRTDRRQHAEELFSGMGIDTDSIRWLAGADKPLDDSGRPNGNLGCTLSHRAVLDTIINEGIPRALVFEDDVDRAFTDPSQCQLGHANPRRGLRVNPQIMFAAMEAEIPADWDILYLGGHYAETPLARASPHIVKTGRMFTTSSYGITNAFARKMAPSITGIGPIDSLYSGFLREANSYCLDPRIFNQMAGFSDLMEKEYNPAHAMQDLNHVKEMDAGKTYG